MPRLTLADKQRIHADVADGVIPVMQPVTINGPSISVGDPVLPFIVGPSVGPSGTMLLQMFHYLASSAVFEPIALAQLAPAVGMSNREPVYGVHHPVANALYRVFQYIPGIAVEHGYLFVPSHLLVADAYRHRWSTVNDAGWEAAQQQGGSSKEGEAEEVMTMRS